MAVVQISYPCGSPPVCWSTLNVACDVCCTALQALDENMRHHRSWFSLIGVRIQEQETLQASYHLSQSGCELRALVDCMLSILNRTELVRYCTYIQNWGFTLPFFDQLTITGER